MQIGPYKLDNPLILAPMAGVTDRPFRNLCRQMGAGMTVAEMISADNRLWQTRKGRLRLIDESDPEPRSVQIVGTEPEQLAEAARLNVDLGAQIIDINMGCPAKKVCQKAAGSALMRDEKLVASILRNVVNAVAVPVTLKIRTGWDHENQNALAIAHIAEDCGIQTLAIHGRTRADYFKGEAEYDTIATVKQNTNIPIIANGDIHSPDKAAQVLAQTHADALMIGRGAQGQPWIFQAVNHYLQHGENLTSPDRNQFRTIVLDHITAIHEFYGEQMGVRIARKHIDWYLNHYPEFKHMRRRIFVTDSATEQFSMIQDFLEGHSFTAAGIREGIAA
jgi:tRNA-dihydrouridine synthase B